MRWDAVLKAVGDEAVASPTLARIFTAANIRLHGSQEFAVPSLQFRVIADTEGEEDAPCTVQWDIWTDDEASLTLAERILRRLFHHDLPVNIGGVEMITSVYVDGSTLASPDRDGLFGRAVRFSHVPLREQYVAPGH